MTSPRSSHAFALGLVCAGVLAGLASAQGAPAKTVATPSKPANAPVAAPAETLRVDRCTLTVGHRVFTDFRDRITVPLHEEVVIGDSDWSAEVVEFQPDFTMDLATRKVGSRSLAPHNPAVRVIVSKGGTPQDTSWAFLKMPPHFGRKSMLAFQLTRVTFTNHAPVEADSALLAQPQPHAPVTPPHPAPHPGARH